MISRVQSRSRHSNILSNTIFQNSQKSSSKYTWLGYHKILIHNYLALLIL